MIYEEHKQFDPNRNITDVRNYMLGGFVGWPVFVTLVACTKKYKPILMYLILVSLTGLVLFNYAMF